MDSPNYTWKADAEEETVERQMAALKLQSDEKRRKQREIELMKSNIFYPFPNQSTSQSSVPSTSEDFNPMPSTSAMPPSEIPSCSAEDPEENSNVLEPNDSNNPPKIIRYDIDELKSIASKMQLNIQFKRDKKPLLPGPVPFQRCAPPVPLRKNGLYRCVKGLEMPEPLNDVLNKLVPDARRFRMIRKTSHIRTPRATEEEELENMYNQEEP